MICRRLHRNALELAASTLSRRGAVLPAPQAVASFLMAHSRRGRAEMVAAEHSAAPLLAASLRAELDDWQKAGVR